MTNSATTDPRPLYRAAQAWVLDLLAGVAPDQYELPTPCTDWDVRTLCAHHVGTVERARVIGAGALPDSVSSIAPAAPDDRWADAYQEAAKRQWEIWDDDAVLTRTVTVPWGIVTGADALVGYVREALVHGWDLAVATGQASEADPEIVGPVLRTSIEFLPAGIRVAAGVPFAEPVDPPATAGATEQLANWFGHARP